MESLQPSPLIYTQDETFVPMVGEPLALASLRRVLVAKWDALYAEALRAACAEAFREAEIAVARTAQDALAALRARPADFAVLGLTFADADGVDLLETVSRERLARRVFVVSGRKDEHTLRGLRVARFDGFFDPREENVAALVEALRQVADGAGYISPGLLGRLVAQQRTGSLEQHLTSTELQVLSVIGDGSDDAEAAARLGVGEATIHTHRGEIMRKLGVGTSAKLVREAVRLGVVRIGADGEIVRPGFEQRAAARKGRKAAGK